MKNTPGNNLISNAIEKGIHYLLSKNTGGRWKGFPTLAGESDVWVTGFVLANVKHLCGQQSIVESAEDFLLTSRHTTGGWSYSAPVPADADSTAWCLMALQSCSKLTVADAEHAKAFLWSHFKDHGISTYKVSSGIREFISAPDDATVAGWTSAHPDVSIAAVLADNQNEKATTIINWVSNLPTNTGMLDAYWWRGPYYTTTLLLRAISKSKLLLLPAQTAKIATALAARQLPGGGFTMEDSTRTNAFTTALALESFIHLSYPGQRNAMASCGDALLNMQHENGSWSGGYILRIPAPFVTDPNEVKSWINGHGGGGSFVEDKEGLFATAMACYALDLQRQA